MDKLAPQQILLAARWWRKVLENPKFQTVNSPEEGEAAFVSQMMAQTLYKKPDKNILDKFEHELRNILAAENPRYVDVDYNPDRYLRKAAESVGMDAGTGSFPWKTTMFLDGGKVKVRYGYGADLVDVDIKLLQSVLHQCKVCNGGGESLYTYPGDESIKFPTACPECGGLGGIEDDTGI